MGSRCGTTSRSIWMSTRPEALSPAKDSASPHENADSWCSF